MANENTVTVNRTFKSTVFIMLFEDKNNLLELFNAMTGKHYTDPDLLEINTLENAIYMTMKNDISFLIDGRLSLYGHQSTYNPNLPLPDAVERAIDECIREGVLREFLSKHRAEAKEMSIFEYDQEKHMRMEREDAWEDGHAAGIEEGHTAGIKEGRIAGIEEGMRKTARNLSEIGVPIETIASAAKVSVEEVQEWLTDDPGESSL